MSDQHPQVEDELDRAFRLGLATAGQIADRAARTRQDLDRHAQHRADAENRQLDARLRAEAESATARLALVNQPAWWNRATGDQIASMYELAARWSADQPVAAAALETVSRQARDRYGIDLHPAFNDVHSARAALASIGGTRTADQVDVANVIGAVRRAGQRDAAMETSVIGVDQRAGELPDRALGARKLAASDTRGLPAGDRAGLVRERTQVSAVFPSQPAQPSFGNGSSYDSADRPATRAYELRAAGVAEDTAAVAMRADVTYRGPATAPAVGAHGAAALYTHRGSTAARGTQHTDRGR